MGRLLGNGWGELECRDGLHRLVARSADGWLPAVRAWNNLRFSQFPDATIPAARFVEPLQPPASPYEAFGRESSTDRLISLMRRFAKATGLSEYSGMDGWM